MAVGSLPLLTTRPALPADRDGVMELVETMGGHEGVSARPGAEGVFGAVLDSPSIRSVVAVQSGRVVGYAEIHARPNVLHATREAWLAVLAVTRDRRGEGIGEALLAAIDREAARLGCERVVLETSSWRTDAHRFYERAGFTEGASSALRLVRPVREPLHTGLVTRFLDAAARAATAAVGAVAIASRSTERGTGADGHPTSTADLAAEDAIVAVLEPLGLAVISEESGNLVRSWSSEEPWICLDPLDGSRNHRRGHPPWATAVGLVLGGQPIAGFVLDHTSGRRWWASSGGGAWVDGRPARPVTGGLLAVPSVGALEAGRLRVPPGFERVRMSGSTSIDLCRVADGSLGAFLDSDRGVVHPHHLAASLAILIEAGASVGRLDRAPILIEPDPTVTMHLAVAADAASLEVLLGSR